MKPIVRYIPLYLGLFAFTSKSLAQQTSNPSDNIPQSGSQGSGTVSYPYLQDMPESLFNYVRTLTPDFPSQAVYPVDYYVRQTRDYVDGLGRPLQSIAKTAHPSGADIVQPHVYDEQGRESIQYLPFAAPTAVSGGAIKPDVRTQLLGFYNQQGQDEQPYSKTVYDNSPLARITQQLLPGKSWVGSNRGQQITYKTNSDGNYSTGGINPSYFVTVGCFPLFTISNAPGSIPVYQGNYSPGTLYINTATDEDGKMTEEIKDKFGRTVIKRSLYKKDGVYPALAPAGLFADNWAYTYYVYDDLGRLRAVLPPEALKSQRSFGMSGNTTTYTYTWSLSQDQVNGLCFTYLYDYRGRLIEKKIPGKAVEYFLYDNRDRLVMQQDGNLRTANKWTFTLYDNLSRPYLTGIYQADVSETRDVLQNGIKNQVSSPNPNLYSFLNNYNIYHSYPQSVTNALILGYTFYDDYSDPALSGFDFDPNQFSNISFPANNTIVAPEPGLQTAGMVTGTKVRVLDPENPGADSWLTTVNHYDDKNRLIQVQSQNLKGGLDISSNIYFFQGMLWKNILRHQNPSAQPIPGTADGAHTEFTIRQTQERNLRQNGGSAQVTRITEQINNGIEYDFARYSYDHLGRVVVKETPAADMLQEYNMRGFLRHIDVTNTNNTSDSQHLFEEKLYYDSGFAGKLYNGNIAGITWRKAGSAAPVEAYGYSYDLLNRLTHAEYRRLAGADWKKNTYDYTASGITYDQNGNLQSMSQMVVDPSLNNGVPFTMDQLSYTYAANSNQLMQVEDAVAPASTTILPDFKNGASQSQEYNYDANGNMTSDANKHISSIVYNYFNKPEKITVDNQGSIYYTYDAAGNRLRKKVVPLNGPQEIYDYIGNFVYKDSVLQYIQNSEGRARPVPDSADASTKFVYDYFVKDHLGNVRSTVTAKPMSNMYLASMEISMAGLEQLVFDNITPVRDTRPGGGGGNTMAARLNADHTETQIGTAIMLRVMPGDKFTISADAFYDGEYNPGENISANAVIESLTSVLMGGSTYGSTDCRAAR